MFCTILILLCPAAPASDLRCPWYPLTATGKTGTQRARHHLSASTGVEGLGTHPRRAGGPLYILFLKKSTYERGILKEGLLYGVFFLWKLKYISVIFSRKEKQISVSLCLCGFLSLSFCLYVNFCFSLSHTHTYTPSPTHTHTTHTHIHSGRKFSVLDLKLDRNYLPYLGKYLWRKTLYFSAYRKVCVCISLCGCMSMCVYQVKIILRVSF